MILDLPPLFLSQLNLPPVWPISANSNELVAIYAYRNTIFPRLVQLPLVDHTRISIEDFTSVRIAEAKEDLIIQNCRGMVLCRKKILQACCLRFEVAAAKNGDFMSVRVTSEDPNFAFVENGASAVDRVFIGIKGAHLAK